MLCEFLETCYEDKLLHKKNSIWCMQIVEEFTLNLEANKLRGQQLEVNSSGEMHRHGLKLQPRDKSKSTTSQTKVKLLTGLSRTGLFCSLSFLFYVHSFFLHVWLTHTNGPWWQVDMSAEVSPFWHFQVKGRLVQSDWYDQGEQNEVKSVSCIYTDLSYMIDLHYSVCIR